MSKFNYFKELLSNRNVLFAKSAQELCAVIGASNGLPVIVPYITAGAVIYQVHEASFDHEEILRRNLPQKNKIVIAPDELERFVQTHYGDRNKLVAVAHADTLSEGAFLCEAYEFRNS